MLLPRDTNELGSIFGDVILSSIDQAGLVEARKTAFKNFAAVAMRDVEFIASAFVGDLAGFYTRTVRVERTSITVEVTVEAQRSQQPHSRVRVTQTQVTYVAVDNHRRPIPARDESA